MNGVHDLGGMQGFGPVEREENEPVFHAPWEGRVFAMRSLVRATTGLWSIDEGRHSIERMDPAAYLASSYYERWLVSLETLCVEKGLLDPVAIDARTEAIAAGQWAEPAAPPAGPPISRPIEQYRRAGAEPRFVVGDAVLTRRFQPAGHTRLPRYARGRQGVIDRVHGVFVFPDTNAHGEGEQPQPLYSVRFTAEELWGESAEPRSPVFIDLWESYLLPA